jgi:hypothetical protein
MHTRCPFCATYAAHRLTWCALNGRILLHNGMVMIGAWRAAIVFVIPPQRGLIEPHYIRGLRKCSHCGRRFLPSAEGELALTCWQCGYCLIGNESGHCPECNHPLARLQRALAVREVARPKAIIEHHADE